MKSTIIKYFILAVALIPGLLKQAMGQPTIGGHSGGAHASGGEEPYQVTVLDLDVILAGGYNGTDMNTSLNDAGYLPTSQPYDQDASAPWYYTGAETVPSIPGADVVDWLLLELRKTTGAAGTATSDSTIARQPAFLLKDGSVVALDGTSFVRFHYETTDDLYIVVWHRNHLPAMNSPALIKSSQVYSHDFTSAQSQAFQEAGPPNNALAGLSGGKFGLHTGDARPDTLVHFNGAGSDREEILNLVGPATVSDVVSGYHAEDVNLDGYVKYMGTANDKVAVYNALEGDTAKVLKAHVPE